MADNNPNPEYSIGSGQSRVGQSPNEVSGGADDVQPLDEPVLDEDQKHFLSRLDEIGQPSVVIPHNFIPSARLNFGLQEFEDKPQKVNTLASSIRQLNMRTDQGKEKGYIGVVGGQIKPTKKNFNQSGAQRRGRETERLHADAAQPRQSATVHASLSASRLNQQPISPHERLNSPPVDDGKQPGPGDLASSFGSMAGTEEGLSVGLSLLQREANKPRESTTESFENPGGQLSANVNLTGFRGLSGSTAKVAPGLGGPSQTNQQPMGANSLSGLGGGLKTLPNLSLLSSSSSGPLSTSGSSLSALASQHLSNQQSTLGSLGGGEAKMASGMSQLSLSKGLPNLSGLSSQSASGPNTGISLATLAAAHSGQGGTGSGLGGQLSMKENRPPSLLSSSGGPSSPGLSLRAMADMHISGMSSSTTEMSSSPASKFTIPNLFGQSKAQGKFQLPSSLPSGSTATSSLGGSQDSTGVAPTEDSSDMDIDLMAALRDPSMTSQITQKSGSDDSNDKKRDFKSILLFSAEDFLSSLRFGKERLNSKHQFSSLATILKRRWRRRQPHGKLSFSLHNSNLQPFRFEEPSPDDIVRKHQCQSRAFASRASPSPSRR